ncbi:MAG TPA: glycosyltransferase family 2 protein [Thermomicrobiales bacterium]|nr:glycosyltransferase family 2 protein [Thermomicrobiales bacterium]
MTAPRVSVVICAYAAERWDALEAAVAATREQRGRAAEVVVVVDHNRDLYERARRRWPDLAVVENAEAPGLSGARNSGVAAARGDILAFLDDDAVPAPDWLDRLLAGYREPAVVGVGGAIEPAWACRRPRWFPSEFDWVVGCTYRGLPEHATPVRNLIGANMSYRREAFAVLGGFRLGYGCDETEFCIRLAQRLPGRVLLYQPAALIRHQVPAARATWRYFCRRCYFEGGSKAVVARLVGAQDGLASERRYTARTLPRGVARGLADAARGDPAGLARAGAIAAGLALTAAGYLRARLGVAAAARARGWAGQLPARGARPRQEGAP